MDTGWWFPNEMKPLSLPKGFERLVGDLGTGTDVQRDQLVSMVTQTLAGPKMETEPTKLAYDKSQGNQTNKLIYGGRIKNFKYNKFIEAESTNTVHDRTVTWFEVNSFHWLKQKLFSDLCTDYQNYNESYIYSTWIKTSGYKSKNLQNELLKLNMKSERKPLSTRAMFNEVYTLHLPKWSQIEIFAK